MGYGDEIIATGLARGARDRGKRIAFGNRHKIIWGPWCNEIFRGNHNIAWPGSEGASDLEWIEHYKGHRLYVRTGTGTRRWIYNESFRVVPGELFFDPIERTFAKQVEPGFVLIEPHVKSVYPNKQWPVPRYIELVRRLKAEGLRVCQFDYKGGDRHVIAEQIKSPDIRRGFAMLKRAALYIGPEGSMAHAAAAVGTPAVVLFGGFTPPKIVGYDGHAHLTGGAEPCGNVLACGHCLQAMLNISVDEVVASALELLKGRQDAGTLSAA